MTYRIIVDSTCDLPEELLEAYNMRMLPLSIHFGDDVYRDRVDIQPQAFYKLLEESNELPKTSQITPMAFIDAFKEEREAGNEVICITLASNASGTYQSAVLAKEELEDEGIHLIDSSMLSMGTGILALFVAKGLEAGKTLEEVLDSVDQLKEKIETVFSVDTLTYLKKGGRIKASTAAIGEILNIKPILRVADGITETIGKVRGSKQVMDYLVKYVKETWDPEDNAFIAVGHGCVHKKVDKLVKKLRDELNYEGEIIVTEVGATIGAHAGPGVFGIYFIKK